LWTGTFEQGFLRVGFGFRPGCSWVAGDCCCDRHVLVVSILAMSEERSGQLMFSVCNSAT
jgi:hypothetical protein